MIKILIIGCGPHATHFYLPSLQRMAARDVDIKIAGILDLDSQREFIMQELHDRGLVVPAYFISPFTTENLSEEALQLLNTLVDSGQVNAIIISTDPLNHKSYAKWALAKRLPILMDKPVTTRINSISDAEQAQGIEDDFKELYREYQKQPSPRPPFILCAHRRYHPGILEVRKIIRSVSLTTGCPVTNIHSMHADGQWRLPMEICTQRHHSYNQGHGKISHSGFHFIDCIVEFWKEGLHSGKKADSISVFSSFVRPNGLLRQLTREDYLRFFGDPYKKACPLSDEELRNVFAHCGEIDAEISLSLSFDGEPFSLASLSLMHNSYSKRSWLTPGRDLYKGNGRVKHEEHVINIGPFLNIQVHSYQSKDKHDVCTEQDDLPGGNNHFDILIFRNDKMIGGKAFEKISLSSLESALHFSNKSLFITQVKERSIEEWISAIRTNPSPKTLLSAFESHDLAVSLMSAIYRSYNNRIAGKDPVETIPWRI